MSLHHCPLQREIDSPIVHREQATTHGPAGDSGRAHDSSMDVPDASLSVEPHRLLSAQNTYRRLCLSSLFPRVVAHD